VPDLLHLSSSKDLDDPLFKYLGPDPISETGNAIAISVNYSSNNERVQTFKHSLQSTDWNSLYNECDVKKAYNKFDSVVTTAFYKSFPMKRLSRNKAKDKPWVTNALKKSSRIKNALYKKWVKTRSSNDEVRYKRYRSIYKKKLQLKPKILIIMNYLIKEPIR